MLMEQTRIKALRVQLEGVIQGVGFRPFVYKLAKEYQLNGFVYNSGQGVVIEIEGQNENIEGFLAKLIEQPPALASISGKYIESIPALGRQNFEILNSQGGAGKKVLIPPDVALCADCRQDMLDPKDRHFHYPFTNCTNCGPRFTIVKDLPYDRVQTSMAEFPMCGNCEQEYHDPADRRFHAQPVACPDCGPMMKIIGRDGQIIALENGKESDGEIDKKLQGEWSQLFREYIRDGNIVAIKGLGGFHLACDANNEEAIAELRKRKKRPAKPLAVMARDLGVIRKYCHLTLEEEKILQSPAAPIVILDKLLGSVTSVAPGAVISAASGAVTSTVPGLTQASTSEQKLPELLAPGVKTLGVMLPYTPLHMLLFDEDIELLVMTSGNASGLPLAKDNEEALEELKEIADIFLVHNRPIINRCDDSLVRVIEGDIQLFRRSRGYVPQPVTVPALGQENTVLGLGSEMKNTFCLLKDKRAFLSQHIGEMESLENIHNYLESLENFQRLIDMSPQVCGYDLHPDYQVTQLIQQLPYRAVPVQHHHAHLASCMAENGLDERVIGLVMDGTGYGLDGNIWGFEILAGNYLEFERLLHLRYVQLPGGESAVRNPWRTAIAYLVQAYPEQAFDTQAAHIIQQLFPEFKAEIPLVLTMLRNHLNTPLAGSCGRLFDAVAALTGICRHNTYDGQAAIELSDIAANNFQGTEKKANCCSGSYPFEISDNVLDPAPLIRAIVGQIMQGVDKATISAMFHRTVVEMICATTEIARERTGLNRVVLSGGSWQNQLLFTQVRQHLLDQKFEVYYHTRVPANDGGLALGQAMIAGRRWLEGVLSYTGKSS